MDKRLLPALLLLINTWTVSAQTLDQAAKADPDKTRVYVTDQLRLSLYQQPNSSSEAIELLSSGDALIIDETNGPYALVTTETGKKGWVKRGFLDTKPTANILLEEEKRKTDALRDELEKLNNSKIVIDQYEADMNVMSAEINTLQQVKEQALAEVATLKDAAAEEKLRAERASRKEGASTTLALWSELQQALLAYWLFLLPLLLIFSLLGYVFGRKAIEARMAKKFHGVKVW